MRRLWLTMLGLCGLVLTGCQHVCSHGVCDCVWIYDDMCCTRSPWVRPGPPAAVLGAPPGTVEVAPVPLPAPVPPVKGL